jgi:hypothetical protein
MNSIPPALPGHIEPGTRFLQTIFLLFVTTAVFNSYFNVIFGVYVCLAWLSYNLPVQALVSHYGARALAKKVMAEKQRKKDENAVRQRPEAERVEGAMSFMDEIARNFAASVHISEGQLERTSASTQTVDDVIADATIADPSEPVAEGRNEEFNQVPNTELTVQITMADRAVNTEPSNTAVVPVADHHSVALQDPSSGSIPWAHLIPIFYEEGEDEFTCIGNTRRGERCRLTSTQELRAQANARLRKMRSNNPEDSFEYHRLLELANWLLCKRWHRDKIPQGPEIAAEWYHDLKPARDALANVRRAELIGPITPIRSRFLISASSSSSPPSLTFGDSVGNHNSDHNGRLRDSSPQTPVANGGSPPFAFGSPNALSEVDRGLGSDLDALDGQSINPAVPVNRNLAQQFQAAKFGR